MVEGGDKGGNVVGTWWRAGESEKVKGEKRERRNTKKNKGEREGNKEEVRRRVDADGFWFLGV